MGVTRMYRDRSCEQCGGVLQRVHYLTRFCNSCADHRTNGGGKREARAAVGRAVRRGQLPPASACQCVDCGGQARDYDHRDYSRPLDVEPVCRSCNKLRGPGKARQSGVVGADPSVDFSRLNSHGLKHGQPSPATPLN